MEDKLDLFKEERVDMERLQGWARGTIREIIGDLLYCSYEGYPLEKREMFERSSSKIAPLGKRAIDWDWRDKLVPSDTIDIFDQQGKWFLGTVLDMSEEGEEPKKLFVGFRVYLPSGIRTDQEGRRHEGWSSQYDTWIPAHSIRIQKYIFL